MADKKNSAIGKGKEPSEEDEEEEIVWPPTVIVENTRLRKMEDGRWIGIGNQQMAQILQENGHTRGKPKSWWGKEGHRGVMVESQQMECRRRRGCTIFSKQRVAERICPFWHGIPGHEDLDESPDFII